MFIIFLKEILDPDNLRHPFGLSVLEIGVIKEICENDRPDYETQHGFYMIKRTKIEEVKELLKLRMTYEEVKKQICKKEIYSDSEIKELIKLAGYYIRDMKTNQSTVSLKRKTSIENLA
jgi:hypothetical protein